MIVANHEPMIYHSVVDFMILGREENTGIAIIGCLLRWQDWGTMRRMIHMELVISLK